MKHNESLAYKMVVRTKKEDSAFLYNILEASEGLAAYSTVNYQVGDRHRDVELLIPASQLEDVKKLLQDLSHFVEVIQGDSLV